MADLLAQGGDVVDGSGGAARRADVRVRAGRVVEIGPALVPAGEFTAVNLEQVLPATADTELFVKYNP